MTTATPHYYHNTFCSYSYILVVHITALTIRYLQKLDLVGVRVFYGVLRVQNEPINYLCGTIKLVRTKNFLSELNCCFS